MGQALTFLKRTNAKNNKTTTPSPCCHLVGSIPLATSDEVFRKVSAALPHQLRRIPDGEPGERDYFISWQQKVFAPSPHIMSQQIPASAKPMNESYTQRSSETIRLDPVRYDEAALASYEKFRALRDEGVIPRGVRFQVILPTPLNTISLYVDAKYQAEVEVMYEQMMVQAVRRIQSEIPKEDLAIQWDMALEFALIEDIGGPFKPWFSPLMEGIGERITRLAAIVDDAVELGFHLCYGDMEHKHFIEPKDSANLVQVANLILANVERTVDWIHLPVPKGRTDTEYFTPMRELKLKDVELYLGLVHFDDKEGTMKRIAAARNFVENFGVATECGMGRTPPEQLDGILNLMADVNDHNQE